jgi:hypothetical protein
MIEKCNPRSALRANSESGRRVPVLVIRVEC